MAENTTEVEERVDLDEEEDNYMEEIDDEIEEEVEVEQTDDDEDGVEDGDDDENDSRNGASGEEQSPRGNMSRVASDGEHKPNDAASMGPEDKEKHAQLLALPPHGSEVFIGGLPREIVEEDLHELCEPIGEIFEVRIMKDKGTGESKGYAFVAFTTKEAAKKAIEELHNKEFKGKTLRCSLSETKNRLFIGNVPKNWTEEEFRKVVEGVGPGIEIIELIKDPQAPGRNRGFAFILYYNNACADYSRQKMLSPNFKLDGNTPTVTWADPKSTPDNSAASQVKALYVKNIPENITTDILKEIFQRHGEVTKVVMPPSKSGSNKRDFGFVHYAERSSALKAVKDSEKYEIDGHVLEVVLAKPQSEKKPDSGLQANLPHPGFGGFVTNPFGSLSTGFGVSSAFQQPMIYGRGPMPSGMHMVPMVLPDGRIGYVLQQPGMQMPVPPAPRPRRVDRNNGPGGQPGRGSGTDDGNRGRRYRPY